MNVRRATPGDADAARRLWDEFVRDATFTPYPAEPFAERLLTDHLALLAEDAGGEPVGAVYANLASPHFGFVYGLYVAPAARRRGVATALMRAVAGVLADEGREHVVLSVDTPNSGARALYASLGFVDAARTLRAETSALLERRPDRGGETFGSIHVQTDDEPAVEQAVRQFVPRLPGGSRGSVVAPPRNGWVSVYDDVCDRDPRQLHRLARELSDRLGAVTLAIGVEDGAVVRYALLERGTVMDEYASVPEHAGPLPPGEVVALAANPRVAGRLTGADPERLRAVARQAASPADLPAASELVVAVAEALGVERAGHGWLGAADLPGARTIER